jgi:hypothetical protein
MFSGNAMFSGPESRRVAWRSLEVCLAH